MHQRRIKELFESSAPKDVRVFIDPAVYFKVKVREKTSFEKVFFIDEAIHIIIY